MVVCVLNIFNGTGANFERNVCCFLKDQSLLNVRNVQKRPMLSAFSDGL